MTYRPDFSKAYIVANEILVTSKVIDKFPFSTTKLIKEFSDLSIHSFSRARSLGINPNDLGSKSALISRKQGKHILFFNDNHLKTRIKFSLLHEFGHFLLGHEFTDITDEIYNKQEVEANFFAAQILMPKQLIDELRKREVIITERFLIEKFGVSKIASQKRLEHINKVSEYRKKNEEVYYDDIILKKYEGFINSIKGKAETFESCYEKELERQSWFYWINIIKNTKSLNLLLE